MDGPRTRHNVGRNGPRRFDEREEAALAGRRGLDAETGAGPRVGSSGPNRGVPRGSVRGQRWPKDPKRRAPPRQATKLSEDELEKQRQDEIMYGADPSSTLYDPRGIHICDLAAGCGFGELGFQGDRQAVRSASVVAAERTVCLVSSANVYLKLMEHSVESELRRKIDWLAANARGPRLYEHHHATPRRERRRITRAGAVPPLDGREAVRIRAVDAHLSMRQGPLHLFAGRRVRGPLVSYIGRAAAADARRPSAAGRRRRRRARASPSCPLVQASPSGRKLDAAEMMDDNLAAPAGTAGSAAAADRRPTERRQVELALLPPGEVFGVCEHVEDKREMTRAAYATRASTAYYCGSNAVETLMYEDEKTRGLMGELAKKRRKWETLRVSQSQAHEAARRPSGIPVARALRVARPRAPAPTKYSSEPSRRIERRRR